MVTSKCHKEHFFHRWVLFYYYYFFDLCITIKQWFCCYCSFCLLPLVFSLSLALSLLFLTLFSSVSLSPSRLSTLSRCATFHLFLLCVFISFMFTPFTLLPLCMYVCIFFCILCRFAFSFCLHSNIFCSLLRSSVYSGYFPFASWIAHITSSFYLYFKFWFLHHIFYSFIFRFDFTSILATCIYSVSLSFFLSCNFCFSFFSLSPINLCHSYFFLIHFSFQHLTIFSVRWTFDFGATISGFVSVSVYLTHVDVTFVVTINKWSSTCILRVWKFFVVLARAKEYLRCAFICYLALFRCFRLSFDTFHRNYLFLFFFEKAFDSFQCCWLIFRCKLNCKSSQSYFNTIFIILFGFIQYKSRRTIRMRCTHFYISSFQFQIVYIDAILFVHVNLNEQIYTALKWKKLQILDKSNADLNTSQCCYA